MISPKLPLLSLLVAFTLAVLPDPARAEQFVMLEGAEGRNSLALSPTDIVTLVGGSPGTNTLYGTSAHTGTRRELANTRQLFYSNNGRTAGYTTAIGSMWTGLSEVSVSLTTTGLTTLRIIKQGESFLSNPVALPTNVGGPIEISVETSTDSINWVPAAPGIIPANSPLGFWRLKAKEIVEEEE